MTYLLDNGGKHVHLYHGALKELREKIMLGMDSTCIPDTHTSFSKNTLLRKPRHGNQKVPSLVSVWTKIPSSMVASSLCGTRSRDSAKSKSLMGLLEVICVRLMGIYLGTMVSSMVVMEGVKPTIITNVEDLWRTHSVISCLL
jgi:hypothetical protein